MIGVVLLLTFGFPNDLPGLPNQQGQVVSASSMLGKVTVIDFAANWCGPCHKALPHIAALAESFPEINVVVISVDTDEPGYRKLIKRHQLQLPVLWDKKHEWVKSFNPPGMPTTIVLDQEGKKVYQHTGFSPSSMKELEASIKKLLN